MNSHNYLFNPNTWGTVSDWFMAIVTLITAYYLYRTLQSQKDVQQLQTRLFEIEQTRFRESIKPNLNYEASDKIFMPTSGAEKILTFSVTNDSDGVALGISKVLQAENKATQQVFIPTGMADTREHLTKGDQPLLFHFKIEKPNFGFIVFTITYKDIAGTAYRQSILCHINKQNIEVHRFLPEIMN